MKIKKIVGSFLCSILLVLSMITINKGYTKVNADGDVTVSVSYSELGNGFATAGTTGTITKTVSSTDDLSIVYSGVNSKSEKGKAYTYAMFLKNNGFAYSNNCPENYFPSKVTVTFSNTTGVSGTAGINFSSAKLDSRNSSVTGAVSQSGTCTATNINSKNVYWNFSTTGANVQVSKIEIVYSIATNDIIASFDAGLGEFATGKGENIQTSESSLEITLPSTSDLTSTAYKYSTLTGWNDGTNTHVPGATVTITESKTYTAVYAGTTITLSQAVEICSLVGSSSTILDFTIGGLIDEIVEYNEETDSKYYTLYITDGTNRLECYKLSATENNLSVYDYITVTGKLSTYKTTTPEFVEGATYTKETSQPLYFVEFTTNCDTTIDSQIVSNGSTITKTSEITNLSKAGCDFGGWYQNSSFTGDAWNIDTDVVNSNITLYAKWIENDSALNAVSNIDSYMQLSYSYDCSNVRTTDTLTIGDLGISSTSYTQFENKNFNCGTYTGLAAYNKTFIQMNGEERSFITTSSSGRISKLSVVYGKTDKLANTDGRTINIYGSNTAYTDLASSYTDTLIGTITYSTDDTSGSVVLNGDYKYVRFATSNAMYFESISLEWITSSNYSSSNFVFRCSVDSDIKDLLGTNGITDYGIYVKCNTNDSNANANEVYFSYKDSSNHFYDTTDGKWYVLIQLGDLLNATNIDRVSYEFEVHAYVAVDSTIKISAKSKTYSVASAINAYHGMDAYKDQVADLYGYLVANEKIVA